MTTTRHRIGLAAAAAMLLFACDPLGPVLEDVDEDVDEGVDAPAELVADTCTALQDCCGMEAPFCAENLASHVLNIAFDVEWGAEHGLNPTRDEACPLLPFDAEVGARCEVGAACVAPCKPYAGTVGLGEACVTTGAIDDCAQGLLCYKTATAGDGIDTGLCADPCDRVGSACDDLAAEWPTGGRYLMTGSWPCGPVGYCAAGGVCAAVRLVGEACSDGMGCAPGLYCEVDGAAPVCVAAVGSGAPCDATDECVDGHICDEGTWTCLREWTAPDPGAPLGCTWLSSYAE